MGLLIVKEGGKQSSFSLETLFVKGLDGASASPPEAIASKSWFTHHKVKCDVIYDSHIILLGVCDMKKVGKSWWVKRFLILDLY